MLVSRFCLGFILLLHQKGSKKIHRKVMNQSIGIDSFKRINPTIDQNTNKRKHTQKNPTNKTTKSKNTHTQIKRENIKKKS